LAIYLDSAIPDEARQAMGLGFVRGITTNPTLLAKVSRPPAQVLRELCGICSGIIFYQLTASTAGKRLEEGEQILLLDRDLAQSGSSGRIGLKIPASTENMALVAAFSARGAPVAVTAMFSLAQAYAACEAGAAYLLPYVNRTTRLRGDGIAFVKDLTRVCEAVGRGTAVLAASIKSPEEAVQTLVAGAQHVSMPLSVLLALGHDPLSEQAVAEFARSSSAL
jgi:transaldolase